MESLKQLLNRFPVEVANAKVIDVKENICHIILENSGQEIWNCSINSIVENKENQLTVYPKEESIVVVGLTGDGSATILAVSEVEKIYFRNEKAEFTFDGSGFQFNRDGENLKEVLNGFQDGFGKLCDELAKVVVSIGVTPDVPAIMQIKNEIVNTNKQALNKILT
ncbi:hypothetical protein QX233_22085 [Chryseobacterium gambrini]|uniref:Uncharacterized protein n=1 Tax=Chryseobacterium gambrini TaxID=373672 RepID=A0AAJ1R7W2_9FLAO|nr:MULTISPECIES: hypothetical protein [Chryseobacterium]MDN4015142.1 hypothetical protein [Chryseobacterium gambrini]QWA37259.1 hypothetical protein KKI44_15135 [Chryseobacterium sp. ZHDP1]